MITTPAGGLSTAVAGDGFDYEDAALKPQMNTDCTSVFICGFILCSLRNQKISPQGRGERRGRPWERAHHACQRRTLKARWKRALPGGPRQNLASLGVFACWR